jgi:D-inositol-3-phosphate glycosyltransferase
VRIALLIPELTRQGGGERQCLYLAKELQELGQEVTIYTAVFDSDNCYPNLTRDLRIRTTGRIVPAGVKSRLTGLRELLNMKLMARQVAGHYDVLNPHGWPPHWAAASLRQLAPVVWMCNDYVYLDLNKAGGGNPSTDHVKLHRQVIFKYDVSQVKKVSKVVVLSNLAKRLVGVGYQVNPIVIRSGVSLDNLAHYHVDKAREFICKRYRIPFNTFLILTVTILLPHRRIEDLLLAIKKLRQKKRDIYFILVGSSQLDKGYFKKLVQLARDLEIQTRIRFVEQVPESQLPYYYHACDAFVFPCEYQTWGLVVTEAMACKKPVLVSQSSGVAEIIEDNRTGLIFPVRSPEALAKKIDLLIKNQQLAKRIALNGYRYVANNLSWRNYAQNMQRVFHLAIEEKLRNGAV